MEAMRTVKCHKAACKVNSQRSGGNSLLVKVKNFILKAQDMYLEPL